MSTNDERVAPTLHATRDGRSSDASVLSSRRYPARAAKRGSYAAFVVCACLIAAAATFVRTRDAALVFIGNEVVALDPDSQYHQHRARTTLAHCPPRSGT